MKSLPVRGFRRAHGLGNDYLVVDAAFGLEMNAARARRICDRHVGVGSDGVLVHGSAPDGFDASVAIWNPDGSEAEKSGNGVRIFAAHCFAMGADPRKTLRIHTLGGEVRARLVERRAGATILSLSMGHARFPMGELPMLRADGSTAGIDETWIEAPLVVGDRAIVATCLSMGNPHAVLLGARCDDETLRALGPLVERHAQFPRRTNVQLCEPIDRRRVRALIWERGAGVTLASGSSACAVAAACVRAGTLDRDADLEVVMPGGSLTVRVAEDWSIEQTGPVEEIADGVVSDDLWSSLRATT